MRQFATDLFDNGAQGEVLKKNSAGNMDFGWGEGGGGGSYPEGGDNGDVLMKAGDDAMWISPDQLVPRTDVVYNRLTQKNVAARIDRIPISEALYNGTLSASFANETLTLVISNESDESISVWFDVFFSMSGSVTVGEISSEQISAVGPVVWNLLEVKTLGELTLAAGASQTVTIALSGARSVNTTYVYEFTFADVEALPSGGQNGYVLVKNGNSSRWARLFPTSGGQNGYVLIKDGDSSRWENLDTRYPRMDIVANRLTQKNVAAKIDMLSISEALYNGTLSASFENGTLTLVISNDSDESISVWFDLFFDISGDYTVGTVSSQNFSAAGPVVWNLLEVKTLGDHTIAAGASETVTIALTDASSADTERVFTFIFAE